MLSVLVGLLGLIAGWLSTVNLFPDGDGKGEGSTGAAVSTELAQARARIAELEGATSTSQRELEAARVKLGELEAGASAQAAELAQERERAQKAAQSALEAHRRALLAEHANQVVPELIAGGTVEELDASVERAKAAYQAVGERVRQQIASQQVPGGAGARTPDAGVEALSPLDKIAAGLKK